MLDEKKSEKIKAQKSLINEVKLPEAHKLKQKIEILYGYFKGTGVLFNPAEEQSSACVKIAEAIKEYWQSIIDVTHQNLSNYDTLLMQMLRSFPHGDHEFLIAMMETQLFNNIQEETFLDSNTLQIPKNKY